MQLSNEMEENAVLKNVEYPKVQADFDKLSQKLDGASLVLSQLKLDVDDKMATTTENFLKKVCEYVAQKDSLLDAIAQMENEAALLESLMQQDAEFAKINVPEQMSASKKDIEAKMSNILEKNEKQSKMEEEVKALIDEIRALDGKTADKIQSTATLRSQQNFTEKMLDETRCKDAASIKAQSEKLIRDREEAQELLLAIKRVDDKLQELQRDQGLKTAELDDLGKKMDDALLANANLETEINQNLIPEGIELTNALDRETSQLKEESIVLKDSQNAILNSNFIRKSKEQELNSATSGRDGFKDAAEGIWSTVSKLQDEHKDVQDTIQRLESAIDDMHPSAHSDDALLKTRRQIDQLKHDCVLNKQSLEVAQAEKERLMKSLGQIDAHREEILADIQAQQEHVCNIKAYMAATQQPKSAAGDDDELLMISSQQDTPLFDIELEPELTARLHDAEKQLQSSNELLSCQREALSSAEQQKKQEKQRKLQDLMDQHVSTQLEKNKLELLRQHMNVMAGLKTELANEDAKFKKDIAEALDRHSQRETQLSNELKKLTELITQWENNATHRLSGANSSLYARQPVPQAVKDKEETPFSSGMNDADHNEPENFDNLSIVKRKLILPRPYYQHRALLEPTSKHGLESPVDSPLDEEAPISAHEQSTNLDTTSDHEIDWSDTESDIDNEASNDDEEYVNEDLTSVPVPPPLYEKAHAPIARKKPSSQSSQQMPAPKHRSRPRTIPKPSVYDFPAFPSIESEQEDSHGPKTAQRRRKTIGLSHQSASVGQPLAKKSIDPSGLRKKSLGGSLGWEDSPQTKSLFHRHSEPLAEKDSSSTPRQFGALGAGENVLNVQQEGKGKSSTVEPLKHKSTLGKSSSTGKRS